MVIDQMEKVARGIMKKEHIIAALKSAGICAED
jgi:hypothetical protein